MSKMKGIVLQAYPFKDYHLLALIYTSEWGLIKLSCPYARARRSPYFGYFIPLNEVEVEFSDHEEIGSLKSASLIRSPLSLRTSYSLMEISCSLLKAIQDTQLLHKEAPLLYNLLHIYLNILPETDSAETLLASFKLKLLRHDGILSLTPESCIYSGDFDDFFTSDELEMLIVLGLTTSIQTLKKLIISTELAKKIDHFFKLNTRNQA